MLAAWRAHRPRLARTQEEKNQLRVNCETDRCLCSLLLPPHWKGRLDPKCLNPQRSTGSSGTFTILGFYWLLKAFSCIQQLRCLIKYAFFSALGLHTPVATFLSFFHLRLKTGASRVRAYKDTRKTWPFRPRGSDQGAGINISCLRPLRLSRRLGFLRCQS